MESKIMTTVLTSHGVTVAFQNPTPAGGRWACAESDPELFFPADNATLAAARRVCDGCPMRDTCLALAQARKESGVWGGVLLDRGRPLEAVPVMGRPRRAA